MLSPSHQEPNKQKKATKDGYPVYPASEDAFYEDRIDESVDPEDPSKAKQDIKHHRKGMNEGSFEDDKTGGDLDIPGAELDDDDEAIGNEDEENNYYSLGGDNHENLEENENDYL